MTAPNTDRRLDPKVNIDRGTVQVYDNYRWRDLFRFDAGAGGGPSTPAGAFFAALVVLAVPPALRMNGTATITGLTLRAAQVGKSVLMWQDASLEGDAVELDAIQAAGVVTSTSVITVYWSSRAPIVGSRNLSYVIGA